MNETNICNKCGQEFTLDEHRFGTIKEGDFVVQYLDQLAEKKGWMEWNG